MLSLSRSLVIGRRWMSTAKTNKPIEKGVKTTYDAGKELEERVARMLKKRGHWCIKQNQRVKDRNGNWSEFDIVYGWPVKHYVECKNYSQPVKLEMVAKFKEVLRLHRIPKSRGLFVTTSTYTPRATTIGITCIDGVGLERLEKTAGTALLIKVLIFMICGAGGYGLYHYLTTSDSEKVVEWRNKLDDPSIRKVKEELVSSTTEIVSSASSILSSAGEAISSASEAVSNSSDLTSTASEVASIASDFVTDASEIILDVKDNVKSRITESSNPTDAIWEVPSLDHIIRSILCELLGLQLRPNLCVCSTESTISHWGMQDG